MVDRAHYVKENFMYSDTARRGSREEAKVMSLIGTIKHS